MSKFTTYFETHMAGAIIAWPSPNTVPDPDFFMECDGTILLISDYGRLFSVLSNDYGGDGIIDFGLPDYRDYYLRAVNTGNAGDIQAQMYQSHTHATNGGRKREVSTTPSNTGSNYASTAYNFLGDIGYTGNPHGTLDTDLIPKTMYVKYYIGY